ncbi:surface antigen BspA-like [Trichomonas vaginalis G3]|uniref:Surface antigen BspA-like n=1 Tax=Trichomonas vaginalis (strain ATCC PRA-98 / G3) TaxID=412133 RepID=A2FL68_TRIV3|nr:ribonuclease inhibitor domain-containing protein [Trichomonas vaginalis G3]EAX94357.1 surface antigen BspA-like [Trichomonas vaginalis G3]KAI5536480.1 ribonuclease inhibitor domain-containing protein [Trichomonas vaginalis G3]|eukprot:XP_001307287.1 surface antigen BspA-like [Trichomonas vaginalis G3]
MHECTQLTFLNYAIFYKCKYLRSIQLPPNLKRIGSACFHETESLTQISLPDTVTTIDGYTNIGRVFGNSALSQITITSNSNLNYIGSDVFANCKLTFFFFPRKLTQVDPSCFSGCPLSEIVIDEENPSYKTDGKIIYSGKNNNTLFFVSSTKTGSFTVPSYVSNVGNSAMRGGSLSEIIMLDNVKTLTSWCVSGNPITTFTFPIDVTTVPSSMFNGCKQLTTVYFTNNITKILNNAFYYCSLLKNVELPPNLTELGNEAFYNCQSLKSISLPESLETLGNAVFGLVRDIVITSQNPNIVVDEYTMYRDNNQTLFTYLGSNQNYNITIRSSCNQIAAKTFLEKNLQNVYFSNNDNMTIGANAFESSKIKSIVMPPGLNFIDINAFKLCRNLENVTFLGNQLKSIPDYCFYKNFNLKYIKLPTSIESI